MVQFTAASHLKDSTQTKSTARSHGQQCRVFPLLDPDPRENEEKNDQREDACFVFVSGCAAAGKAGDSEGSVSISSS